MKYTTFIASLNENLNQTLLTEKVSLNSIYNDLKNKLASIIKTLKTMFSNEEITIIHKYFSHELSPIVLSEAVDVEREIEILKSKTPSVKKIEEGIIQLTSEFKYLSEFIEFLQRKADLIKKSGSSTETSTKHKALINLIHHAICKLKTLQTIVYTLSKFEKVDKTIKQIVVESPQGKIYADVAKLFLNVDIFQEFKKQEYKDYTISLGVPYWQSTIQIFTRQGTLMNQKFNTIFDSVLEYEISKNTSDVEKLKEARKDVSNKLFIKALYTVKQENIEASDIDQNIKDLLTKHDIPEETQTTIIKNVLLEYKKQFSMIATMNKTIKEIDTIKGLFDYIISRDGYLEIFRRKLRSIMLKVYTQILNPYVKLSLDVLELKDLSRVETFNLLIQKIIEQKQEMFDEFQNFINIKIDINKRDTKINKLHSENKRATFVMMELSFYVINFYEPDPKGFKLTKISDKGESYTKTLTNTLIYHPDINGMDLIKTRIIQQFFDIEKPLQEKIKQMITNQELSIYTPYQFAFSVSHRKVDYKEKDIISNIPIKSQFAGDDIYRTHTLDQFFSAVKEYVADNVTFFTMEERELVKKFFNEIISLQKTTGEKNTKEEPKTEPVSTEPTTEPKTAEDDEYADIESY